MVIVKYAASFGQPTLEQVRLRDACRWPKLSSGIGWKRTKDRGRKFRNEGMETSHFAPPKPPCAGIARDRGPRSVPPSIHEEHQQSARTEPHPHPWAAVSATTPARLGTPRSPASSGGSIGRSS